MAEKTYTITDEQGLQAQRVTLLVNTANKFASEVSLEYKARKVNLKSIMGVMSLGVSQGSEVKVSAMGEDAEAVIKALTETLEANKLISA
ncbi:MAG: phosphocarrier protein HPr [Bacillus sp. (in: firmicutes)]